MNEMILVNIIVLLAAALPSDYEQALPLWQNHFAYGHGIARVYSNQYFLIFFNCRYHDAYRKSDSMSTGRCSGASPEAALQARLSACGCILAFPWLRSS